MNKSGITLLAAAACLLSSVPLKAQTAFDAYNFGQSDLKGTARYMSMAGAFGALGGDLTTLSHNPAGIGVYRNNEVGITFDLDVQHNVATTNLGKFDKNQTKFLVNNVGFVWTLKLNSSACPNLNIGFTYDRKSSFNRRYKGSMSLNNSLSNYLAALSNGMGYNPDQLAKSEINGYNPWYSSNPANGALWLPILGYQRYLFTGVPVSSESDRVNYVGQWDPNDANGNNTTGYGDFNVQESGGVDSYNIALGGNIANVVYWGMDFDISHISYRQWADWTEYLDNALVGDADNKFFRMNSDWRLSNYYSASGTGFNFKLGVIVKPIQELRFGLSFETPTWYSMSQYYYADFNAIYGYEEPSQGNPGYPGDYLQLGTPEGSNDFKFRTPWKLNASIATVLFNKLIVSAEYEWQKYSTMKFSKADYYYGGGYDPWYPDYDYPWDWYPDDYYPWYPGDYYPWYSNGGSRSGSQGDYVSSNPFRSANKAIKNYYKTTNTLRLGAEFRVTPQFSVRAGYSYVSSPTVAKVAHSNVESLNPSFRLDDETQYVTAGLGYRIKFFSVDLAYVFRHQNSEYYSYSQIGNINSQKASLSMYNHQIVLTAGFKF